MRILTTAFVLAAAAFGARAQSTIESYEGSSLGTRLGASVALVDDLDGDGRADVVVGCPGDDTNGDDAGAVRVYSGANGALIRTHLGAAAGDQFGRSVTAVGDVDDDGACEYAVGIPFADANGSNSGQVKVFSGATGAVMSTLTGGAAGDRYGWVVDGIGKMGDYLIAIGAPYADPNLADAGAVYVRPWNGGLPGIAPSLFLGSQAGEHFGWSIDASQTFPALFITWTTLLIGAPDFDAPGAANAGRVEKWFSESSQPWDGGTLAQGTVAGGQLGYSVQVTSANLDFFPDSALGAPGEGGGAVHVYGAGASGPVELYHLTGTGRFGEALASGYTASGNPIHARLFIGAPDALVGGVAKGRVSVFEELTGIVATIDGTVSGGRFGAAMSSGFGPVGGDVNADGLHDLAVGAPESDVEGSEDGWLRAYRSPSLATQLTIVGPTVGSQMGRAVAGVGDVNADGVPDFAVGAPSSHHTTVFPANTTPKTGAVRVVSGATGALLRSAFGDATGDELGWSVAAAGDLDLDGVPDFLAGAPQRNHPSDTKGYARAYSGATGALLFDVNGSFDDDEYGYAVGGGSDLNGDGRLDVLVGAPGTTNGTVYAYSGVNGFLIGGCNGEASGDRFGESVAGLGADLTGDGKDEYLVGAPRHDLISSADAGRVYVVRSIASLLTKWVFNGAVAGDHMGTSVAAAGDVNRDGTIDVVVGEPGYDTPAAGAGRIRVYSGFTGFQLASVTGVGANDGFGQSVAGLGDVDDDGYADYAGGAYEPAFIVSGPGYAKVVSGKAHDTLFTIAGSGTEGFAYSLAGLGDVNLDGIPDLVGGAPFADGNGPNSGLARVVSLRPQGVLFYGTVPAGCDGPQLLATHGVPKLGSSTFGFRCNHAPPSSLAVLLVGDAKDPSPTGTDLFGLGAPFLVDLLSSTVVYSLDMPSDLLGYGATSVPLPNVPAFTGAKLYAQSLWVWPAAECALPPIQIAMSSGVQITLQ